ncbi:hypothetical protein T459_30616 [Capsicum annuum]|uniref:Uncharacterized protein n=1 Tax=Capsicum annuum TaxID=4072 RepID=A0A2G2Y9G3_CAPAN|nr:hypothetical protein T459_30616 [Capsicum annuum]
MNPLSKRSFNYSFNSLSSAGAILYGKIDIGRVSGKRSMPKSISLSGGIPRRSSGKTSEYSFTIGTDSSMTHNPGYVHVTIQYHGPALIEHNIIYLRNKLTHLGPVICNRMRSISG